MKRSVPLFLIAVLVLLTRIAWADGILVSNAWVRATPPGQTVAGLYLEIESGSAARLVGVSCPLAASAELHQMTMDAGTMRMRAVDAIDLPAGKTVSLKPGGYHIMLFGLKQGLKPGEAVPFALTLTDAKGGSHEIETTAQVRNLDGSEPHQHH